MWHYADSRLRLLLRRLFSTRLPAADCILFRQPCLFFRLNLFGLYVGFIFHRYHTFSLEVAPHPYGRDFLALNAKFLSPCQANAGFFFHTMRLSPPNHHALRHARRIAGSAATVALSPAFIHTSGCLKSVQCKLPIPT